MHDPDHLEILRKGVEAWNEWREESPEIQPYLNDADLRGIDLSGAALNGGRAGHRDAEGGMNSVSASQMRHKTRNGHPSG